RWREAAGGDLADHVARAVGDLGAFAGGRTFDEEPDARAAQLAAMLPEDAVGAGEIAGLSAAFGYGEAEPRFRRRNGFVEVVAIERQASLEAERIAGA